LMLLLGGHNGGLPLAAGWKRHPITCGMDRTPVISRAQIARGTTTLEPARILGLEEECNGLRRRHLSWPLTVVSDKNVSDS
jgi:hypothetical protein